MPKPVEKKKHEEPLVNKRSETPRKVVKHIIEKEKAVNRDTMRKETIGTHSKEVKDNFVQIVLKSWWKFLIVLAIALGLFVAVNLLLFWITFKINSSDFGKVWFV